MGTFVKQKQKVNAQPRSPDSFSHSPVRPLNAHLQQCSRVPLLTVNQSSALTVSEHIPSSHPVPRSPRGPPYYLNSLLTGLSPSSSSSTVERVILKQHRVMQLSSSKTVMHSPFHIGSSSSSLLIMWRCVFLVASHPSFILQHYCWFLKDVFHGEPWGLGNCSRVTPSERESACEAGVPTFSRQSRNRDFYHIFKMLDTIILSNTACPWG